MLLLYLSDPRDVFACSSLCWTSERAVLLTFFGRGSPCSRAGGFPKPLRSRALDMYDDSFSKRRAWVEDRSLFGDVKCESKTESPQFVTSILLDSVGCEFGRYVSRNNKLFHFLPSRDGKKVRIVAVKKDAKAKSGMVAVWEVDDSQTWPDAGVQAKRHVHCFGDVEDAGLVECLAASPNGTRLAAMSASGVVSILIENADTKGFDRGFVGRVPDAPVLSLACLSSGQVGLFSSGTRTIAALDLETGTFIGGDNGFECPALPMKIACVPGEHRSRFIVGQSDGRISMFDPKTSASEPCWQILMGESRAFTYPQHVPQFTCTPSMIALSASTKTGRTICVPAVTKRYTHLPGLNSSEDFPTTPKVILEGDERLSSERVISLASYDNLVVVGYAFGDTRLYDVRHNKYALSSIPRSAPADFVAVDNSKYMSAGRTADGGSGAWFSSHSGHQTTFVPLFSSPHNCLGCLDFGLDEASVAMASSLNGQICVKWLKRRVIMDGYDLKLAGEAYSGVQSLLGGVPLPMGVGVQAFAGKSLRYAPVSREMWLTRDRQLALDSLVNTRRRDVRREMKDLMSMPKAVKANAGNDAVRHHRRAALLREER